MLLVWKCAGKVDHVLFMDDLKLYSQNKKHTSQHNMNTRWRHENGIRDNCATLAMKIGYIKK